MDITDFAYYELLEVLVYEGYTDCFIDSLTKREQASLANQDYKQIVISKELQWYISLHLADIQKRNYSEGEQECPW